LFGRTRRTGARPKAKPSQVNVRGLKNRLLLRRAWVISSLEAIDRLRTDLNEALELLELEMAEGV
ncbi:MAG: hypothetical protein ACE5HQ_12965, partial [Gemmatimonadota bacterium]